MNVLVWPGALGRGSREAVLILASALALYLVLSLISYDPSDPGWSHSGRVDRVLNQGGRVGAWLSDVLFYLFGYLAYLLPALVAYGGWTLYRVADRSTNDEDIFHVIMRSSGFVLTLTAGCALATLHFRNPELFPLDAGGVFGNLIGGSLERVLGPLGATLLLLAVFLTGITLLTSLSWLWLMDATGRFTLGVAARLAASLAFGRDWYRGRQVKRERVEHVAVERKRSAKRKPPRIEPVMPPAPPSKRVEAEKQVPLFEALPGDSDGALPVLSLLDPPKPSQYTLSEAALEAMSRQVELKLHDFGLEVEVVAVHPGPVITRFELQPAPGLKSARITNVAKDLARSLSTVSVRIVEVIPGKSVIGLEIPNENRELVCLSEIIKSQAYEATNSPLALALGKDIAGKPMVVDLARMPHLLVAGTTGSGKSVAINAMVLSQLFKAKPSDVRMIMIDPKMLELSVYDGIPHLLAPVVTDMKHAANALRWCVAEMERRYQLMSKLGVRNIAGYNRKLREARERGEPLRDPFFKRANDAEIPPELEHLPFIVVLVDEFADLMMVAGKKVEELIARLAQKARASGIHLILATQRPSVDVITGLIKANIPSRIAFQVSSRVDSRTILDQMGAEQLLGHGDMLYLTPGMPAPIRVHGAFVSDQEVHRVVSALKKSGPPQYREEILEGGGDDGGLSAPIPGLEPLVGGDSESDPLYDQAVQIVTETRRASISGVQRRLKIGYNRAARMLEQMEATGVVGPLQSNGARDVLAPPPVGGD